MDQVGDRASGHGLSPPRISRFVSQGMPCLPSGRIILPKRLRGLSATSIPAAMHRESWSHMRANFGEPIHLAPSDIETLRRALIAGSSKK
jgi:hypothetical protein